MRRPRRLAKIVAVEAGTWLLDTAARMLGSAAPSIMWAAVIAGCTAAPWIVQERERDRSV